MNLDTWSLIVQGASALGTVILAVAVWFQIRTSREQVAATRETVDEMRERARAQGRCLRPEGLSSFADYYNGRAAEPALSQGV